MANPCPNVTEEAKEEEEDAVQSKQDTTEKSDEKFCLEDEQETNDTNNTRTNKTKHSPDRESISTKKRRREDLDDDANDVPHTSKKTRDECNDNTVVVAKHYNSLEDKGALARYDSRILYMRNFNNWVKSVLISEYLDKIRLGKSHGSPLKVLDMCCGKGGDLLKWQKANVSYVICADLAETSIEQCQCRYNDMKNRNYDRSFHNIYSAEFISADCTKVHLRQKFADPSIQLDLVSCQFALHYSFESLQQAECMMRNASENLKPGGYFIGSIPDAYDLVSRWQKCDSNKFGNSVFNIEFLCDKTKPPLFGAKYNFHLKDVVDCPEFLVYLPLLCKIASKFGLELVKFERFDDFYERTKHDGKSLLSKIKALETYPPNHDTKLIGPEEDYQHAAEYIKSVPNPHKIGTLSQPEWEVISLYAIFVFQKMKTVWDSKGKPEYEKL